MADRVSAVSAPEKPQPIADQNRLDAFGMSLSEKRKEAIDGRRMLGIETEWFEDEEYYDGIDDANRGESLSAFGTKPPGAIVSQRNSGTPKATLFINITRPYTDAAAARVSDMLVPSDEKAWKLQPTPIPELTETAKRQAGEQLTLPNGQTVPEDVLARAILEVAEERCKKADKQIDDWLYECRYTAETRAVVDDAAKVGTGVMKGPFPMKRTSTMWHPNVNGTSMEERIEIAPGSKRISYWNLYPDPTCGESIHNGRFIWERDSLTPKQLRALIGTPGYINEQLAACLLEGPRYDYENTNPHETIQNQVDAKRKNFDVWYYHGEAEANDMAAAGIEVKEGQVHDVMVTMVNHRVVRVAFNPLKNGEFPYDLMVWQRRPGMPWGRGIARQCRAPQRMIVAATRNMMDNAALGSGPIIAIDEEALAPLDGNWTLSPRKVFTKGPGKTMEDVRKAIQFFEVPLITAELQSIIEFALRMAEQTTGLPLILQGMMSSKSPDTVGGMTIQQNNASSVLRRLAKFYDDYVTKPHITRYYHWLMQRGQDEETKGEFDIIPIASSTLVERDLQNQELALIVQMAANPSYDLDPKRAAEEYLKSRRFDPKNFKFTDEEKRAMAEQPAPADPKIEAANIKAQTDREKLAAATQEGAVARQHEAFMKQLDMQLAELEAENNRQMSIAELRAKLAETVLAQRNENARFTEEMKVKKDQGSGI